MIIQGSMRYSPSGRKRKTNAWKKTKRPDFVAQAKKKFKPSIETKQEIPSMKTSKYSAPVDNSWKIEESKKYPVAPAYNKGAYQVIPASDIKHIGK
tara:strand:+ start:297 stop:584 length:288 start_codon:yes stop_codon:yes gene_type:complete